MWLTSSSSSSSSSSDELLAFFLCGGRAGGGLIEIEIFAPSDKTPFSLPPVKECIDRVLGRGDERGETFGYELVLDTSRGVGGMGKPGGGGRMRISGDLGIGGSGESGVRDLGSTIGEVAERLCAAGMVADLCGKYKAIRESLNRYR